MTFENLIGLIRGKLLTKPSVSSFENFCFNENKVQRGDLFIAYEKNDEEIGLAVQNGAYGVICERDMQICDEEIAWIKVSNIQMTLFRLMRYESSLKKLNFISITKLQANMLSSITLPKNAFVLSNEPKKAFRQIIKAQNSDFIFCANEIYLQKIAPSYESILNQAGVVTQKNGSIFVSSFIHNDKYYQKLPIPPLFIPHLCGILSFLDKKKIKFSLENFKPINNFEPIFVDSLLYPKEFGMSSRALIIESNESLFLYEAQSLLKSLPQNQLLICKHINSSVKMEANFLYKDEKDLKDLMRFNFKYALILGDKNKILETISKQKKQYPSLF